MKLLFKFILAISIGASFTPNVYAGSEIVDVDQMIRNLAKIKAPKRKSYKKVKKKVNAAANRKFYKGKNKASYGPTKAVVSFKSKHKPGTIIIKTAERKIYYVTASGKAIRYGIAVGSTIGRQWKGNSFISRKRPNPTWIPTASIIRENPKMKRVYKPGPNNPLGVRALNLGGTPTLRIHGTNQPWTIGTAASHGCYRMRNVDVIDLYNRVKVGTRVVVQS